MKKPNIGLAAKNLKGITNLLTVVLADAVLLYTKTRKFHWNVSGNSFIELHELFEQQYKSLEQAIDEIAERINKLGSNTPGTMEEFLKLATLKENPGKYPSQLQMITELLDDHESTIRQLRKHIDKSDEEFGDMGTSDFLTDLIKEHETIAWKLRRYLS